MTDNIHLMLCNGNLYIKITAVMASVLVKHSVFYDDLSIIVCYCVLQTRLQCRQLTVFMNCQFRWCHGRSSVGLRCFRTPTLLETSSRVFLKRIMQSNRCMLKTKVIYTSYCTHQNDFLHYMVADYSVFLHENQDTLWPLCHDSSKLEELSNHKSAKTHAGNVFVTRDLDL